MVIKLRSSLSSFGISGISGPISGGLVRNIYGTPYADELLGTFAAETIYAYGGDDIVEAGGGNDLVYGGDGADILDGGDGNDVIHGDWSSFGAQSPGDDVLFGGI